MTDPTTTPGDEPTAALLVDRTSSTCGACGKPTLPSALTHANVSGYDPKPGGGCGARFVAIRSVNRGVTDGHLRSLRPDLPVDAAREQQTTTAPYTDADLRTLAVRVHEAAARDSDSLVNGAVKRKWGAQLDVDQLDEAGDELIGVLDKAANTSRWAVDLGADGLQPHPRALDGGDGPRFRVHFAFAADMDEDDRADLISQFAAFMTHGLT